MQECVICFDEIKKNAVTCPYCEHSVHVTCAKTHLLNEMQEPSCFHPDCMKNWSREVLDNMPLPKSWLNKELREHRARVLFERERALFPATLERLASRANLDYMTSEINRLREQLSTGEDNGWFTEAVQNRNVVTREHVDECLRVSEAVGIRSRIKFLTACYASMAIGQKVVEGSDTTQQTQRTIEAHEREYMFRSGAEMTTLRAVTASTEGEEKKPKILFHCPVNECRGFIGSYNCRCLVCNILACKSCREVITKTTDVTPEDVRAAAEQHVCDPNTLASLALLDSDSKPCPSCFAKIHRTEGCPVMFCTSCGSFFNWNSLKKLQGRPHNPHYEEYRRAKAKSAGIILEKTLNDAGRCAGRLPTDERAIDRLRKLELPLCSPLQLGVTCVRIMDLVRHIRDQEITVEPDPQEVNLLPRLLFLRGQKTEEKFKQIIQQNDKKTSLQRERNQVWEMFCAEVTIGLQTNIMDAETASPARAVQFLTGLEGLIHYVNNAMKVIGKRYNHLPYLICRSNLDVHTIYSGLDRSYTYQVQRRIESNLSQPREIVYEAPPTTEHSGGVVTKFIGALQSLINPVPQEVIDKLKPAVPLTEDQLYKRPRVVDISDDNDSD